MLQISGEDLTEAIQSAAESLRSAELNMDNLQEAMNNYTITSPISGTIIEKNAKPGTRCPPARTCARSLT